MIIYFRNLQDELDPDHGRAITNVDELNSLLERARKAKPFIAEFCGAGDFHITIGIGEDVGFVQYSRVDGDVPYLVAVSARRPMKRGYFEFLCGGTLTPIAARFILSIDELKQIVLYFLETGERSDAVTWESI